MSNDLSDKVATERLESATKPDSTSSARMLLSHEAQRAANCLPTNNELKSSPAALPELHLSAADPSIPPEDDPTDGKDDVPGLPGRQEVIRDSAGLIINLKGGSAAFQENALNAIEDLPEADRKMLAENNISYTIVNKLTDIDPTLATQHPRGWPAGKTWSDVDGVFLRDRNTVAVAETTKAGISHRTEGVVKHESGHAFDHAMGDFSQSSGFQHAYEDDIAKMPAPDQKRLTYLLQPGAAGKEETAADVYGALNGSSSNLSQTEMILEDFPEVEMVIEQREADATSNYLVLDRAS